MSALVLVLTIAAMAAVLGVTARVATRRGAAVGRHRHRHGDGHGTWTMRAAGWGR